MPTAPVIPGFPKYAAATGNPIGRFLARRSTLWLVLLLAAALRLVHVLALAREPAFDLLLLDSSFYSFYARIIAAGNWLGVLGGNESFYMDPLYPYFLALVFRCFGESIFIIRLLQVALGVGTCALTAAIGNRVGGRAIGTAAAFCMAVYAPAIHNEGEIEKTALGVFLITLALALALAEAPLTRLGAGICLALATLTRGNLLLLVPLAALYFLVTAPRPVGTGAWWSGAPLREALLFLLGSCLVFGPVMLRNHHVSGEWVLTTSQAGANFYIGNNPDNRTGAYENVPFVRPYPAYEREDFRKEAIARSGRELTNREVSRFWFAEALRHMREHPGFAVRVLLQKAVLFVSDTELPDQSDIYFRRRFSPALRLPLLTFGCLFPLAVLGMAVSVRSSCRARLLFGYVLFYGLAVVLFFILSRYRLHVVPVLAVFAVMGAAWLLDRWRERRDGALLKAAVVLIMTAIFSFAASRAFGIRQHEWLEAYEDMAYRYELEGNYRSAVKLLREALVKDPSRLTTICQLGKVSQLAGNHAEAIVYLQQCVDREGDLVDGLYLLGKSYAAIGDYPQAIDRLQQQLRRSPDHQPARTLLGKLQKLR